MKINKILVSAVLSMICLPVAAQSEGNCESKCCNSNTPQPREFTIAATIGYNSFTNVSAMPGNLKDYEAAAAPNFWGDKKIMVGVEAGFFINEKWKLNLGGGLNFSHNPGYSDKPGTIDEYSGDDYLGEIPNYRAVASQYSCNLNVYAGADRYFNTKVKNLKWFTGVQIGYGYAQNDVNYNYEWNSMGTSVGQSVELRGAITLGMDYFILPGMFVGVSVLPFSYTYSWIGYRPQEGLKFLQADCSTWGALAAPTMKVGFKF